MKLLGANPREAHDVVTLLNHCLDTLLAVNLEFVGDRVRQICDPGAGSDRLDTQECPTGRPKYITHSEETTLMAARDAFSSGAARRVARAGADYHGRRRLGGVRCRARARKR